jgi:hypothetical protein
VRSDGHRPGHLTRVSLSEPAAEADILRCDGGCGRFDVGADGVLVASMGRIHRQVNTYSDLFEVPLVENQPRLSGRRLTHGARARDPALTADGRTVWSVRSHWGRTWLEAYDRRTGKSVRTWRPPEGARIDAPQPHPDGRRLFASMHHKANRDLIEIDLDTGAHRLLTWGASDEVEPSLSPDGRWLLYASDADGIYDIYARDVGSASVTSGRTVRLTRVLTGAFSPRVSPDASTLVYVGWTVDGDELYTMDFAPESAASVTVADPRPGRPVPQALPDARVTRRDYSPWPTLLPRRLAPTILADSTGLARLGMSVGGLDVTERIGANLDVLYDAAKDEVAIKALARLGTSWPDVELSAGRFVYEGRALFDDSWSPWPEEVMFAELGVRRSLRRVGADMGIGASGTLLLSRAQRPLSFEHTPDGRLPEVGEEGLTGAFELNYGISDVARPTWAISPRQGYAASLALRLEPAMGRREAANFQIRTKMRGYIPLPWADQVVALAARGAWSGGPEGERDRHRVGGVPDQDLLADLLLLTGAGSAWLRGYEPNAFVGTGFHLLSGEWRLPLHRLRTGLDTLPIFARDLSLAVFADAGWAGNEAFEFADVSDTRVGVGAELRMVADLLFGASASLRLGYARGLGEGGIHHAYLLMAPPP